MWLKLCSKPELTRIDLGHDQTTGQVFTGQRRTALVHDQKEGLDIDEEEGGAAEVEVELDNSLSLDFSDDDIEYLSDEDEEEKEDQETGTLNEEMEGGASAMTSEIQQLKVGRGRVDKIKMGRRKGLGGEIEDW